MVVATVKRPDGTIEKIDMSDKFNSFNAILLNRVRKATADAGRGAILEVTETIERSNLQDLRKLWRNVNNEGGEGYEPEAEYFVTMPEYKTWTETKSYK